MELQSRRCTASAVVAPPEFFLPAAPPSRWLGALEFGHSLEVAIPHPAQWGRRFRLPTRDFSPATPSAGLAVLQLQKDVDIRIIPQSRASFLNGLTLDNRRPDKGYSLTDCISMQTTPRE